MEGQKTSPPVLGHFPTGHEHHSSSQNHPQRSHHTGTMPIAGAGSTSKSKSSLAAVGRVDQARKTKEKYPEHIGYGYSDSKDTPLQCDVPVYGTRGWKIGDIGTGILTEPLGNAGLLRGERTDVLHGHHGKYIEKPHYFLIEDLVGEQLSVYILTIFSGTDPAVLRERKTRDETLGERPKLNDYVQVVALHRNDGKPVTKDELCFQKGEKQIEWTSTCSAPSKKISYLRLAGPVLIGGPFVELCKMGEVTPETLPNLIDIQISYQEAKIAGKTASAKRKREESVKPRSQAQVCISLTSDV